MTLATAGGLVWDASRSGLRRKKGAIETLYTTPPPGSVVVCLDEMGPLSARTPQGQELVAPHPGPDHPAGRARQEVEYGRCEREGYVFGARQPATGAVFSATHPARTIGSYVDFLTAVEAWLPAEVERIYAIRDNLNGHAAYDGLLFSLAHPRWEFVFQPTYAGI